MNVLDLGCGPGVITKSMSEYLPSLNITGLDVNPQLLEIARSQKKTYDENHLSFVEGSVYGLPFEDNQFDFIYSRFLFQHLNLPLNALNEIFRVLKPKGNLCILDVDDRWLCLEPECTAFEELKMLAINHQKKRGGNRLIGQQLPELLSQSHFENVNASIKVITSYDLGLKPFLDITTGFKKETLMDIDHGEALVNQIESYCSSHPEAWGAVGLFIVTAGKQLNEMQ